MGENLKFVGTERGENMTGQTYLAIIGDSSETKEVEDRSNLQQRLRVAVDRANRLYTDAIAIERIGSIPMQLLRDSF
jgi:hypothetical protein